MKISKRTLIQTLIIVAVVVLIKVALMVFDLQTGSSTTASNQPVQSGHVTVTISHMAYQSGSLTIEPGTTVTWINKDTVSHTVTQGQHAIPAANGFNSKLIAEGQSWSYTFYKRGTYPYTCEIHPEMNASVIVK